ncbi:unnamed protein product, partial [Closterium sp. NIES-64]
KGHAGRVAERGMQGGAWKELHVPLRPVRAGQQCLLSYGPLPSHDLALFYGFLLPSRNPYDCFPLDLDFSAEEEEAEEAEEEAEVAEVAEAEAEEGTAGVENTEDGGKGEAMREEGVVEGERERMDEDGATIIQKTHTVVPDACREDTPAAAAQGGGGEAAGHDTAAAGATAKKPRHSDDDASGAGSVDSRGHGYGYGYGCTTDTATEANDASAANTTRASDRDTDKDRGKGGAAAGGKGEQPVLALSQHLLCACDLTLTPAGTVVERGDGESAEEEMVENEGEDREDREGTGGGGSEDVWGALPWRLCVALCGAVGGSMEERRMWKADALRPPQADIPPAVRSAALSTLLDLVGTLLAQEQEQEDDEEKQEERQAGGPGEEQRQRGVGEASGVADEAACVAVAQQYRREQEQLLLSIRNECVRLLMLL